MQEKLIELLYHFRGFNADKSDEKTSCFIETQDHLCNVTNLNSFTLSHIKMF